MTIMSEMKVISVSEVLNGQTTISKSNRKTWEKLMEVVKENPDGNLLFDFRNVYIEEPWSNKIFQSFMANERVHMKIYSDEKMKNTINTMCRMAGTKSDRCLNEDIYIDKGPSKEEKEIKRYKETILEYTHVEGDTIKIGYPYTNVSQSVVCKVMEEIVDDENKKRPIKKVEIGYGENAVISDNMLKEIAKMYDRLSEKYEVKLDIKEIGARKFIEALISTKDSREMTDQQKMELFNSYFKPMSAGVLTVYKDAKTTDVLGRNKSEILYTRPAIYMGMGYSTKGSNNLTLTFKTFLASTFHRKFDYTLDNEGKEIRELKTDEVSFDISEVGMCDKMVGTKAHFNFPITQDENDLYTVYDINSITSNSLKTVKKTLPEYMKIVFDDYNVEYDSSQLMNCIIANREVLRRKREEKQ